MSREKNRHAQNRLCLWGVGGILLVVCASPLLAQTTVTPQVRPPLNPTIVTVNASPGAQTDPHVSQNLVSYTDSPSGQIRYYNFATGTDEAIGNVLPTGEVTFDYLSDVYNTSVVFTQVSSIGSDIELFDTVSQTLTTIDPTAAPNRAQPAIGGNTVAYIDNGFVGATPSELVVHDITANTATRLTNDTLADQGPQVAPNGQVIVWQSCTVTTCDIKQAVRTGTSWIVSPVTNTTENENNPDTDGVNVVYDSNRATSASGNDIYFRAVAGGPEMQLAIQGVQTDPSIASGIIAFQSAADFLSPNDLYVYRISTNELFQVTNTSTINEVLNDITVLPNGDVRLVWSTGGSEADVLAATFTLPNTNVEPTDLGILKLAPARALAGSKVTYLIGVGNLGSVTASNVIVTDVLPANTTFVSVSANKVNCSVSGGKLTCSTATVPCMTGSTVSCNIGTLMPLSWSTLNGATIKLTVQLGSALTAGKTFSNTATVAGSNADPRPGNNSSTATTLLTSY